jgi:hypothetical protein
VTTLARGLCHGLAAILLLFACGAHAQTLVVGLSPFPDPLKNSVLHLNSSTLSLDIVNRRPDRALRSISFRLPANYAASAASVGPTTAWTATASGRTITFSTTCNQPGLTANGGYGSFVVQLTPPTSSATQDVNENLTITDASDPCAPTDGGLWTVSSLSVPFVRRVLRVTGEVTPVGLLTTPSSAVTATVTWTVTNLSTRQAFGIRPQNALTPVAGWTLQSCTPTSLRLAASRVGTFRCTYSVAAAAATYSIAGNATSTGRTGVGARLDFVVGNAHVDWAQTTAFSGHPTQFTITVVNDSHVDVSRVDVTPPAGSSWTEIHAADATGGLQPATTCTAGTACFTGTLSAGARSTLAVQFSSAPTVTAPTAFKFEVRVTPVTASGAPAVIFSQDVNVLVGGPSDVSGLTVLSDARGQLLDWTNPPSHDGVVVFRTTPPTVPPRPYDYVQYSTGQVLDLDQGEQARVIYADAGASNLEQQQASDLDAIGVYYYRVCSHDDRFVYSDCSTGFWNGEGYLDSAIAPSGGWTHQLGAEMLQVPGVAPGNRVGLTTNGQINVLDLATGRKSFAHVALASLPPVNSPVATLTDGRTFLFVAETSGLVTAVDLSSGETAWQNDTGESFVAGVAGINRAYASADFQAAYPRDILLIGSATHDGNVLAIDTLTGRTLWTVNAGSPVRALITYDSATNSFFVPTNGAGVVAFNLTGSFPDPQRDGRDIRPAQLPWQKQEDSYSHWCPKGYNGTSIVCVDRSGVLRVIDKSSGALQGPPYDTKLKSPSSLVVLGGTSPGFVVGNASEVRRLSASGTPITVSLVGEPWKPGVTLSPVMVFSTYGYLMVAGSDRVLHKLNLADLQPIATSTPPVSSVDGQVILGSLAWDSVDRLFVFGTDEGRVWAIPSF